MKYNCTIVLTPDIPTIYQAWNLGIKAAKGEYLTSANTDDIFYDGALAKMRAELEKTGAGICHSIIDMKREGKIEKWERTFGQFEELKPWCFVGPMPMWRKSLHDEYGLVDESFVVAGDYEFWLRCASKGVQLCYVRESLGLYLNRTW